MYVDNVFMNLPNHIFFTGAPGSRWSGIAQTIESIHGMNTSDRRPDREYIHNGFSGHKGAYFGPGMECNCNTNGNYIDRQWCDPGGCKVIKSHEWAYQLTSIRKKKQWQDSWAMLVYRPDMACYSWWHEAGGFNIKYPNYSAYKDSNTMLTEIIRQNAAILEYGKINNCKWEYFTSSWISENFGVEIDVAKVWPDILVTLIK
jgi:hypothetical protein